MFAHSLGLWERLGGLSAMAEEADQLVGFAQLVAEANGLAGEAHIREKISEMIIHATMIRAGLEAAISHCEMAPEGAAFPNELYTNAAKYHGAANYNLMVRHLHDIAGGSVRDRARRGRPREPRDRAARAQVHEHGCRRGRRVPAASVPRDPRPHRRRATAAGSS